MLLSVLRPVLLVRLWKGSIYRPISVVSESLATRLKNIASFLGHTQLKFLHRANRTTIISVLFELYWLKILATSVIEYRVLR